MIRTFRFYRDEDLNWFVDLPEWEGEPGELQMVAGADVFLGILSQDEDEVYVTLADEPFEGAEVLNFEQLGRIEGFEFGEGAWYSCPTLQGIEFDLNFWLCDVTKHPTVFGKFPEKIYFKV